MGTLFGDMFDVAAGSVTGRDHVLAGKNNQDAWAYRHCDESLVAVVCDGCGSGKYTEIGARVMANAVASTVMAQQLDAHNYDPNGGTPLYDESVALLATVLAKQQEFAQNGVPCRTVTCIITDGADEHSRKAGAPQIAILVKDMLKAETHIIFTMGIDNGACDFKRVFKEMGLEDQWILTPSNNASDIRKAFQVFSQSAVRASQGATAFSKTALGGFGN